MLGTALTLRGRPPAKQCHDLTQDVQALGTLPPCRSGDGLQPEYVRRPQIQRGPGLFLKCVPLVPTSHNFLAELPPSGFDELLAPMREITADPDSAAIADAIIAMAHSLHLRVLAEGVETEGQLAMLRARGCDQMQGYLFSKPLPPDEIAQLLREKRNLPVHMPASEGATLLLVDDDEDVLAALDQALRDQGYRVLLAHSPKVAFELLARNAVQVIVSDQRMPEMNGTEFLARAKDLYPEALRIMLSASSEIQSLREAINRGGVYKFLNKPWDSELLRATIKEAFQRVRVQTK